MLIIYVFDYKGKPAAAPLTFRNVIKNPLRIFEYLGMISFSFYLYHSNIRKRKINPILK